jgi:hypothetical protein
MTSILIDMDNNRMVGMVSANHGGTWTGYDCTRANATGTTSMPLGNRDTRDAAKKDVENALKVTDPNAGNPQRTAQVTDPWASAVDRRWNEVCEGLELVVRALPNPIPPEVPSLLGELRALYKVTQYAGSNARTGWLMTLKSYNDLLSPPS